MVLIDGQWLAKGVQPGDVQQTKELIPGVLDIEEWTRRKAKRE